MATKFFSFDYNSPDACIILNRGTKYEQDITADVRNFNTQNSIDSLVGSFNVTLDNTNDHNVDRFGFTRVKKMSMIEIFAKTLNITMDDGAGNANANYDTVNIPTSCGNLNQFISTYYTNQNLTPTIQQQYKQQIIFLNSGGNPVFPITNNDFLLGSSPADVARMNALRSVSIKVPLIQGYYSRIFLGVVLNVSQSVQPGAELTISLSGKSIGYWLEATSVNIAPGLYEQPFITTQMSFFSNRYANKHALDIIKDLLSFSTDDLIVTTDMTLDNNATNLSVLTSLGKSSSTMVDAYNNPTSTTFLQQTPAAQLNQLQSAEERIYEGFPITDTTDTITSPTITGENPNNAPWFTNATAYVNAKALLANLQAANPQNQTQIASVQAQIAQYKNNMSGLSNVQLQLLAIQQNTADGYDNLTRSMSSQKILSINGLTDHWKYIFSQMQLEIVDNNGYLGLVNPVNWSTRSPGADLDGDYITKADLAKTITEGIMYEFYCDTNGHFILKPPLYNVGIDPNNQDYIIEEDDLISMTLNDTADGIITRMGVGGDYYFAPGVVDPTLIYGIHQDLSLIRDFGFHSQEVANKYFMQSEQDCVNFAKAYMTRNNMDLLNASITINGRPEIRLGTSIYVKPRDTVYYIKEISHEFSVGQQFQTTLTLIGGRRIITGYKVQLPLASVTTSNVQSAQASSTTLVNNSVNQTTITYYQIAPLIDNSLITDPLSTTANNPVVRSQQFSAAQSAALAANPNTSSVDNGITNSTATPQGTQSSTPIPQVLRNVFQITSSINPAFVGLIVDLQSTTISAINVANFQYFSNLNDSIYCDSNYSFNIPEPQQENAINIILGTSSFTNYNSFGFNPWLAANYPITDPSQFTLDIQQQFIMNFLQQSSTILKAAAPAPTAAQPGATTQATGQTSEAILALGCACTVFTTLLSRISNQQSYRQYTDDDGRELPSYFDYGLSLTISNNQYLVEAAAPDAAANKAAIAAGYQPQSTASNPSQAKTTATSQNMSITNAPLSSTAAAPAAQQNQGYIPQGGN